MTNQNQAISNMSITQTVQRQTPKIDFGSVLARGASVVASRALSAADAMTGIPIMSAAVSAVTRFVTPSATPLQAGIASQPLAAQASPSPASGTEAEQFVDLMKEQSFEYLRLQTAVQQESREYNTTTNILKTRHDSARAAINNLR